MHLVLLLSAVLTASLLSATVPATPAAAAAPPPESPGCETYGCVYEECPTAHSRRGHTTCRQTVHHQRLQDTVGRTFVGVQWPPHYSPTRREMWDRVAYCESTWRWAINNGNGYHGGLQFHPNTWAVYGGGEYAPHAWQATPEQQISVAERVAFYGYTAPDGRHLKPQGKGAWPHCGRGLSSPA